MQHQERKRMLRTSLSIAAIASLAFAGTAFARDQIRIVGSSTVYPFATTVAEQFGKATNFKTPVVEATGSGGGLKLFCTGVGVETPDITNASRRIKMSEVKKCQKNGVTGVTEVKVGYDGIVMANSKASTKLSLTRKQIYLALGKTVPGPDGKLIANPNKRWSARELLHHPWFTTTALPLPVAYKPEAPDAETMAEAPLAALFIADALIEQQRIGNFITRKGVDNQAFLIAGDNFRRLLIEIAVSLVDKADIFDERRFEPQSRLRVLIFRFAEPEHQRRMRFRNDERRVEQDDEHHGKNDAYEGKR